MNSLYDSQRRHYTSKTANINSTMPVRPWVFRQRPAAAE